MLLQLGQAGFGDYSNDEPIAVALSNANSASDTMVPFWISAVFLVCLVIVVAFRKDSILNFGMYRWSVIFLIVSIVLPPLLSSLAGIFGSLIDDGEGIKTIGDLFYYLFSLGSPVSFGISVFLGIASMFPRPKPIPH